MNDKESLIAAVKEHAEQAKKAKELTAKIVEDHRQARKAKEE